MVSFSVNLHSFGTGKNNSSIEWVGFLRRESELTSSA